eukprot:scaffold45358_cov38-Prasinocladus_malaysianus.AAC.1
MGRPIASGQRRRAPTTRQSPAAAAAATKDGPHPAPSAVSPPIDTGPASDGNGTEEGQQEGRAGTELDCLRGTGAGRCLDALDALLTDPTAFLTAADQVAEAARAAAKAVFDQAAAASASEGGAADVGALMLPELHVEGFDTEQIWLQ